MQGRQEVERLEPERVWKGEGGVTRPQVTHEQIQAAFRDMTRSLERAALSLQLSALIINRSFERRPLRRLWFWFRIEALKAVIADRWLRESLA